MNMIRLLAIPWFLSVAGYGAAAGPASLPAAVVSATVHSDAVTPSVARGGRPTGIPALRRRLRELKSIRMDLEQRVSALMTSLRGPVDAPARSMLIAELNDTQGRLVAVRRLEERASRDLRRARRPFGPGGR